MSKTILPPISFITYNLGCRTNQAELEVISDQLSVIGLTCLGSTNTQYQLPNTYPNLILINTCMVTQKAERETRKAIRHFRRLYPKAKIVVLGCAVSAKEKFGTNLPYADLWISNEEKFNAVSKILTLFNSNSKKGLNCCNTPNDRGSYCNKNEMDCCSDKTNPISNSSYNESGRKFIKIQDGCSNCCSFCITTRLRGRPKSEEPDKLIRLIREFQPEVDQPLAEAKSGIREVILTGINIGLYGIDLKPQTSIWRLVDRILKETKIERLTLSTVYPEMLWDKGSDPVKGQTLMECIGNPRLTKCFHLALQSGSQSVLQRMNRPTDLNKLLGVVSKIREVQPDFTFRADVIAGFPDETEEEHQETLEFIRQTKICFAHLFPYSPRMGTVAYDMVKKKAWKDVSIEVKKRRASEIRKLVDQLNSELGEKMVGKIYRVLVVREVRGKIEGISDNGWVVIVTQNSNLKSQNQNLKLNNLTKGYFVDIKITGYEKGQLLGEILSIPI